MFSDFIATFVMSERFRIFVFYTTKVSDFSDIAKCLETFVYQTLALFENFFIAELRFLIILSLIKIRQNRSVVELGLQPALIIWCLIPGVPLRSAPG